MRSNIRIQRICEHCEEEFTAQTTVTKYCGSKCAKAAYKVRAKNKKIEIKNEETKKRITQPFEVVKIKEFLSVKETAMLLGSSNRTIYRLIENGTIKAVNIAERMTRIKRSELDKLLEIPEQEKKPEPKVEISDCYSIGEILIKYNVSEKGLKQIIRRNNITKTPKGRFVYVSKKLIDNIFT